MAAADSAGSSLVSVRWSTCDRDMLPAIVAPCSLVELSFDRGNARRMRREGHTGWQLQPPAFVYAHSRGVLRFVGEGAVTAIAFRVSPIVASSLLSRPPAEIWNEPVAFPTRTPIPNHSVLPDGDARRLFNHVLSHAPLEPLDALSNQLGWSTRGLRQLFERSAALSSRDVDLIIRHLDACSLACYPPIQKNLVHHERVRALKLA